MGIVMRCECNKVESICNMTKHKPNPRKENSVNKNPK